MRDHLVVVQYLLDPHFRQTRGIANEDLYSPFTAACSRNHYDVATAQIRGGVRFASMDRRVARGVQRKTGTWTVIKRIHDTVAEADSSTLSAAAKHGRLAVVEYLIGEGVNLDGVNLDGVNLGDLRAKVGYTIGNRHYR